VRVQRPGDLATALQDLGLAPPVPTLVVVGGAADLPAEDAVRLEPAIGALSAAAERSGAAVVDGGTDSGTMRLLGRARSRGGSFPLVGVAVEALAADQLEPNHTHAVLVPGGDWGDEVPWLARVADLLAAGAPTLTVVANGGDIALEDAAASIASGRPVLVLDGSGRGADELASAARGGPARRRAREVAESGLVLTFELREDAHGLAEEVGRILSGRS
jgi:hypothetical protein